MSSSSKQLDAADMSFFDYVDSLRIPYEEIESATNNFSDESLLPIQSPSSSFFPKLIYKGQLKQSGGQLLDILARKTLKVQDNIVFNELVTSYLLKHKNIHSIFKICGTDEPIIISKYVANGSLDKYLSDLTLTWMQRLHICVYVAHALSYIHHHEAEGDLSVMHGNIKSSKILLDKIWEPKLNCSGFSMFVKKHQPHLISKYNGALQYVDPEYVNKGSLTHKSDVFSFGVVLFEVLFGRSAIIKDKDNCYFAQLARSAFEGKKLDDMIDPDLRNQMNDQSLKTFSETSYCCLKEVSSLRPDMVKVVNELEAALVLQQKHEILILSLPVAHLKIPREDILPNINLVDEYFSTKGGVENEYEGQLLYSGEVINITAQRLDEETDEGERQFWTEIWMLSSLRHKNIVSLIGFCYEEDEKSIIYKKEANDSLDNYLSDETLTWMQRLKICVGVANALSYIHYDPERDFSVIHCNIKSSKILLDDEWKPKLFGFEFSLKNTIARRHRLVLTRLIGNLGYVDPVYEKTGGVTRESDVFSFGVVLFEVLCGRNAVISSEELLWQRARSCYEEGKLDDLIIPALRIQMYAESFKIFSETAYNCLKEERADRPSTDQVVKKLEKALELQWKHENPERSRDAFDGTSSNYSKGKSLECLKIGLNDIKEATNNFDDAYCIGSGGFGKVYTADLEHFDRSNSSSTEGVDKCDLPRKRSKVAIKRINNQEGEQGFIAEIETLTSCKHENIISLLGFCYEGNGAMILVYEHASKGSLESYLGNSDRMTNLNWLRRLNICLDIAHGLNYLHNNTDGGKQKMIHRDIKSDNILLGDNWKAMIADFGLSKFHPADQAASTIFTDMIAGTNMYLDPEYMRYGRLNKKSDIYSFGVVLLEILGGRLAYDSVYTSVNENGIAPIAREHFKKGTIMEIVDYKIKEETDEYVFSLSKGPNKECLEIFLELVYRCVAETQAQRPTIEIVIKELQKAINCQENNSDNKKLPLRDVKLATQDFSQHNIIGHGDFGNVYRGVVTHAHELRTIAAKRLDKKTAEGEAKFMTEVEILMEYEHEHVIGLVGYCHEEDERVILYGYASRGSLDKYLSDERFMWVMRLKICIDIAIGLEFLHGTVSSSEMVIHRNITSNNILLTDDWKAKISDFGLSLVCPKNHHVDYVIDNVTGTVGYSDPLYSKTCFLTKESDIFSLGAVLFDILCGKQSSVELDDEYLYLPFLAKHHYQVGKLDELVFEGIKEQILPLSFAIFSRIAYQCLHHRRERRPRASEVIFQLKKALEFQEDYEIWEPKLPKDYKEIIEMSMCPEIYLDTKKEDIYNIFSKGILLQQDKVLLSFDGNGERNKMVSATMFLYQNSCPHEWKSLRESRFNAVVEMLDISNLDIQIKTNTQLLSPNVFYGVYLVFKLGESRNITSKPIYVKLRYRKGPERLDAYFATWRDKEWMTIELYQFLNQNEDIVFDFLLESFSSYYCGDGIVHVEGIEFRAIDKVKHGEIGYLKQTQQVLKSNLNVDQVQQLPINLEETLRVYDELFWLGEVDGNKLLLLSAKATLYKFSNVDLFISKPSAESRFQEVIELLPQQVFHINCTIKNQLLSPDTEYECYLVFKISEQCQGLHCPVKVRDLLHQENCEAEFFYFITPSPLNINDNTRVPKERKDGWMEILVWKFNSAHEFKDESLSMNMKFTIQEGIMSGLIVGGLEFWPM